MSLSMAAIPAAFLTVGAVFLPETPSFIIERDGDTDKARILLQRLRGTTSVQKELGSILAAKFKDYGFMDKEYAYLVLITMCVFAAGFAWSWGPLTFLVPTEICPPEIRLAGQGIVVAVVFLMTLAIGQTFLAVLCRIKSGTFFIFAGWICLMTMFASFSLPETKKLPMEQMEQVWRKHWFWKRIVGEEEEEKQAGKTALPSM
ncbi:hypothetical protein ABZP36_011151 [Zizania latifolia]